MARPKKYTERWLKREAITLLEYARATPIPFECDFCSKHKYSSGYLSKWANEYPWFNEALKRFKDIQKTKIVFAAFLKQIDVTFSIFTLKNVAGWRDTQAIEHSGEVKGNTTQIIIYEKREPIDSSESRIQRYDTSLAAGNP